MDIFGNLLKCLKLEMLQNISRISFKSTFYSVGTILFISFCCFL